MIVVFGSVNLDLVFRVPLLPKPGETRLAPAAVQMPGGKGANQAVAAARDGARVVFAGAVGDDPLADAALAAMHIVDTSRIDRIPGAATGCAAVIVSDTGENMIAVGAGANRAARAEQVEDALLGPETTLLLQMEIPAEENVMLVNRARARGARVVMNLAPAGPIAAATLRAVDLLVVNEQEAAWLGSHLGSGNNAASLHAALGADVVRTLGTQGSEIATAAGHTEIPARHVDVTDTTGAGDCFVGVLAAALNRGASLLDASRRATVAAALACTRLGAQASLPHAEEIDRAMANRN
jgi:ribokinase